MLLASFSSPDRSVWDLGPIPIRAYALCIILGIVAAIWIGERRWVARGGRQGTVSDIAVWAVIFGLVGGRLYHVITDNELYFRSGRDPWRALYVWEGGLGVWGAIALGGVGAWIACRRRGIALPPFADAVAPGIAVAQAIGRWGNYFNQELFGRPTDLPWAVRIDPDRPSTVAGATTYHPAFLYESLWNLALAAVLVWADRRFRMGRGRVFALYVMGYTAGRLWIELLRIDTSNELLGLRINVWTSILVFAGGLAYFLLHPGPRETVVEPGATADTPTATATADTPTATTSAGDPAVDPAPSTAAPVDADHTASTEDATSADTTEVTETPTGGDVAASTEDTAAAGGGGTTAEADERTAQEDRATAAAGDRADGASRPGADEAEAAAVGTAEEQVAATPTDAADRAAEDGAAEDRATGDRAGQDRADGATGTAAEVGGAGDAAAETTTAEATAAETTTAETTTAETTTAEATTAEATTAEEQVAATPTDEPLTVERVRRRLLPVGRRRR